MQASETDSPRRQCFSLTANHNAPDSGVGSRFVVTVCREKTLNNAS